MENLENYYIKIWHNFNVLRRTYVKHNCDTSKTKSYLDALDFRKDTSVLYLEDIMLVSAMGPPGGGRNTVTPRFLRHFNILAIDTFNEETMKNIFTPLLDWHFNRGFETNLRRYSRVLKTITEYNFRNNVGINLIFVKINRRLFEKIMFVMSPRNICCCFYMYM